MCHEGCVLWGPPTKVVCHLPKKILKKRADLAKAARTVGWGKLSDIISYNGVGLPLCSFT